MLDRTINMNHEGSTLEELPSCQKILYLEQFSPYPYAHKVFRILFG